LWRVLNTFGPGFRDRAKNAKRSKRLCRVSVDGDIDVKIHPIETGTVQIKASQRIGRGRGSMRQVNILLDRRWTEPLPILAWAIETDEGVIVVDTGETARAGVPGYLPWWHPYYRMAVRFDVKPEQEIGPQLRRLGIDPDAVRKVIMTHLHTDHAGGLHHFPKSEVLISDLELKPATGFAGRLRGYLPNRWPSWLTATPIRFQAISRAPFDFGCPVTADGRVVIVPTPGHTAGHVSVIVDDGELSFFLAGDTSYTEQSLVNLEIDGVSPSEATSLATLRMIRQYAERRPTVYLPAHDPHSVSRLSSGEVLRSQRAADT
jgi:glyoxylase-like metal-dependent hydrolase (beta-lactamase superfamily II)